MGNIWRTFWYAGIIILLSASCQGDINSRNLLLNSRYTTPPKVGLEWLNKNGNDALAGILKKKKNKRRGRTKARLLFLNCHGRASMERTLSTDTWDLLNKNSFLFLSETWMTEQKYQDLFPEKTTFVVHAKKKSKGRPFGGLQMIINKTLKPKLI